MRTTPLHRPLAAMVAAFAIAAGTAALNSQAPRPGPQQPARDTPAQRDESITSPAGAIAGRVLAADTGRPIKRARVNISAPELPGGRGVLTDDAGRFQLMELPAGRYTLSVSKSGFVSLAYGQRRPLQAGTPLQLAEGQALSDVEIRLPRGSVITGHVYDETGDPMPGVVVRVLRYQYQQGNRRLTTAGTSQTDDLGQYRVWGLLPGDYYVNAQSRINLPFSGPAGGNRGRGGAGAGAIAGLVGAIAGPNVANLFTPDEDENQRAYAPTFFPGVPSAAEAQPVTLGLSQTASAIDFALQLVRVARVSGRVMNPNGSPTTRGNVNLTTEGQTNGRGNQFGANYGSRLRGDGTFEIANVPPGRYVLRARGNNADWPQYASVPVTVAGADIGDISVTVAEGATIMGTVIFQGQSTNRGQVRITSLALEPGLVNSVARIEDDNSFKIVAVPAGAHLLRLAGQVRGWSLKSVVLDGRDITDTPIELRSAQEVTRVAVTVTDVVNEINGTITNGQGGPVTEYTVLAFSTDSSFWRPQSRHIATGRPDQNGKFRVRGLPAGGYYLTAVDPAQQGEWYQPGYLEERRFGAAQVILSEGETKTQNFKVGSQN